MKARACGGISYLIHHEHQCMRWWSRHWPRFWSEKNQNRAISPTRMGREQKWRDQPSCLMLLRPRQCMSSNSKAGNFSFSGKSEKLSALRTLQEMGKKECIFTSHLSLTPNYTGSSHTWSLHYPFEIFELIECSAIKVSLNVFLSLTSKSPQHFEKGEWYFSNGSCQ